MNARCSALLPLACCLLIFGCGDDGAAASADSETSADSTASGDGDGDPASGDGDGDAASGDGDGDQSGDGDGDPAGDGDGDQAGDGDGDSSGDGDGDASGDGDGDLPGDGDGDLPGDGDGDPPGDGDGDPPGDGDGDPPGDGDGDEEPLTFDTCGFAEDGPWVEIEYWQLGSVSSPSWSFSDTPGWGEDQWAWGNEPWPEIFEFGGNSMVNDPIGVVASVSGTWQLMMGLQDLDAYDSVSVCIEGRSISVGSGATMEVSNPSNGCGVDNVQISHSWEVHAVGVELGNCLTPGGGTQAVRIDPWGGSGKVGIKRVRVTLHGAVY